MKHKNLITTSLALGLIFGLSSCSDDKEIQKSAKEPSISMFGTKSESNLLSYIPADTPLLAYYLKNENHPIPQKFIDKMSDIYGDVATLLRETANEAINNEENEEKRNKSKALLDKWLSDENIDRLGFDIQGSEMALYAVDMFPVLRYTLTEDHQFNEVMDEAIQELNNTESSHKISKRDYQGKTIYQLGNKEIQGFFSLENNILVASLAPPHLLESLLPKLLGDEKPKNSLANSNKHINVIKKYGYHDNSLYWLDIRQAADYFINPSKYNSPMLDLLQVEDNKFSPVCKTEMLAMIDNMPRIVGGTTELSDTQMNSHIVFEMDSELGTSLSNLSGRIPNASADSKISYGFSFDILAAKKVAQDLVANLKANPYECEHFSQLNNNIAMVEQQLQQPIPPFVGNFKGMNVVIDELDLDMTKTNPEEILKSVKGNVLLAVDNPNALKGMAEMMMPELQSLQLKIGGDAANISSLIPIKGSFMPVNLDHVFMAIGDETIGLSLGENTDMSLKQSVSNDSQKKLLNFKISSEFYKKLFEGISEITDSLPAKQKQQFDFQKFMMSDMMWWTSEEVSMDFSSNGLEIFANVSY